MTVLTAFRIGDAALSLAELANRTGLIKSTIMRLVVSLEKYGLVTRLADGNYILASEVVRLNAVYQDSHDVGRHIMPRLHQLTEQSGETASFYVKHGAYRLCQYRVNSPHRLRLHLQPGDMRPMDQAAGALALQTPYAVAKAGIIPFYSCGATDPHASSVALPIYDAQEELLGAIVISGPANRLSLERAQTLYDVLRESADELTRSLGGKPIYGTGQAKPKPRKNKDG